MINNLEFFEKKLLNNTSAIVSVNKALDHEEEMYLHEIKNLKTAIFKRQLQHHQELKSESRKNSEHTNKKKDKIKTLEGSLKVAKETLLHRELEMVQLSKKLKEKMVQLSKNLKEKSETHQSEMEIVNETHKSEMKILKNMFGTIISEKELEITMLKKDVHSKHINKIVIKKLQDSIGKLKDSLYYDEIKFDKLNFSMKNKDNLHENQIAKFEKDVKKLTEILFTKEEEIVKFSSNFNNKDINHQNEIETIKLKYQEKSFKHELEMAQLQTFKLDKKMMEQLMKKTVDYKQIISENEEELQKLNILLKNKDNEHQYELKTLQENLTNKQLQYEQKIDSLRLELINNKKKMYHLNENITIHNQNLLIQKEKEITTYKNDLEKLKEAHHGLHSKNQTKIKILTRTLKTNDFLRDQQLMKVINFGNGIQLEYKKSNNEIEEIKVLCDHKQKKYDNEIQDLNEIIDDLDKRCFKNELSLLQNSFNSSTKLTNNITKLQHEVNNLQQLKKQKDFELEDIANKSSIKEAKLKQQMHSLDKIYLQKVVETENLYQQIIDNDANHDNDVKKFKDIIFSLKTKLSKNEQSLEVLNKPLKKKHAPENTVLKNILLTNSNDERNTIEAFYNDRIKNLKNINLNQIEKIRELQKKNVTKTN